MTHHEWLIQKASVFWNQGQQLPLDLFYQLIGAGLDVAALERKDVKEQD